jgi:proliferating cell nuclear antigen
MNKHDTEKKFICKTVQSNAIKTLIEALKDILNDVNFRISENGIQILSVDPNKCAIVHLNLNADHFEYYECQKTEFRIGVCTKSLFVLLKTLGTNDVITLFVNQNDVTRLHIVIENKDKNIKDISKLKLLDIDEAEYRIPEMRFDSVIKMPSGDFQKICKYLINIADLVTIQNRGKDFSMYVDGDIGEKEIIIQENEYTNVEVSNITENDFCETFQLKYLLSFGKSSNLCSSVEIFIKNEFPLVLIYSAGSLGQLKFLLSPFTSASE